MVARLVRPERGSRNRKHHDDALFDVIRNASPGSFYVGYFEPSGGRWRDGSKVGIVRAFCMAQAPQ